MTFGERPTDFTLIQLKAKKTKLYKTASTIKKIV
jgi:hypothetical protein